MNNYNYTSLELSRKLKENGCKLKSNYWWHDIKSYYKKTKDEFYNDKPWIGEQDGWYSSDETKQREINQMYKYKAYDILNDICVRYAKEFFGEDINNIFECTPVWKIYSHKILSLLQQNKKQEAEDYIWEHCLFNPVIKEAL